MILGATGDFVYPFSSHVFSGQFDGLIIHELSLFSTQLVEIFLHTNLASLRSIKMSIKFARMQRTPFLHVHYSHRECIRTPD